MAHQTLELTLISAQNLKHVTVISKMEVYAVSSIDGDRRSQQLTPADREGGTNPVWNATLRFSVPADDPSRHFIHVLLRCHRAFGDRDVGEVRIPLKDLLDGSRSERQFVSYQVRKVASNKIKGVLNLSYKFTTTDVSNTGDPVTAYPAYPAGPSMYPRSGVAAPYPAAAGYGYPVPPQVAAQPVAVAWPGRRNNRLGMGLLGGALGGLLLGDIMSDHHAADYGAGYDAGFDDGGGFGDGGGFDGGGGFGDGGGFDF